MTTILGLVLSVAVFAILRPGSRLSPPLFGMDDEAAAMDEDWTCAEEGCGGVSLAGAPPPRGPELDPAEVCPDAGYLCAEPDGRGELRVLRWPDDLRSLSVSVPAPDFESPDRARLLQSAAVRGIQAWQGRPFALKIHARRSAAPADIVVRWTDRLTGASLGHTKSEWKDENGRKSLRIVDFALATRSPYNPSHALTPDAVELVAAHEMGHALGLPHSDSPRDVMYPTNTARSLSARDFRTLEALYGLPNGAQIPAAGVR